MSEVDPDAQRFRDYWRSAARCPDCRGYNLDENEICLDVDCIAERDVSFLTQEEVDALQESGLSRKTPYVIQGVSHGFFSVARHYGSASYQGSHYVYDLPHDELVRDDVFKWAIDRRKQRS